MSQRFYQKASVQVSIVTGLFVLVGLIVKIRYVKPAEPSTKITATMANSPNSVQIAAKQIEINQSDDEKTRAEMKERIRAILTDVNTNALVAIDSGAVNMPPIYISETKLHRLERLTDFPEFNKYVKILSCNQVQFGGDNNSFGEGI